ncbi:MAG TPA: L-glutamate gamma-semialdehyde dehydrogenase [Isosphaeraceae bacterium]|nr:L-glutamate gamma-semialdehyde dehydrogenase [Isosphaeraceae bacterium]
MRDGHEASRKAGEGTRALEIGRALFEAIGRGPSPWKRAWWDDRLMDLTMGDPAVKVQLFRFIDALPTLREDEAVRRHLGEYLDEANGHVPAVLRAPLAIAPGGPLGARVLAGLARSAATRMARRFIAGSTPAEAFRTVKRLRGRGLAFTADLLGEAIISEAEADAYQQTCLDLVRGLAGPLAREPEIPRIDRDDRGPIPRANLSLKLTSLTPRFDALHAETTTACVLERLRPILRTAREVGAYVHVDMEQFAHKDLTFDIFKAVLSELEFRDWPDVGIVAQAYLHETLDDLRSLLQWVEARGTPVTVRLVKGAYWDYEVIHARQVGWPVPVFEQKWATDASFERCARYLMEHHDRLRPAIGSHNVRSIAASLAAAEAHRVPEGAIEFQMLHGMGEPIQRALADRGLRVRVYTPYGAMLPGMAYLVRRLLENTSNESFLKASFAADADVDELLRDPEEVGAMWGRKSQPRAPAAAPGELPPFRNEPPTDFTRPEHRESMRRALDEVRGKLGSPYSLRIGGQSIRADSELTRHDPSDRSRLVAVVAKAEPKHADAAIAAARAAFPSWSATPARERADVLVRAAAIMKRRRFELAAWEVFECGKPWREADADVAEAIDFCEFYAREMVRLDEPDRRDLPGETNAVEHVGRGVAVVIPPWNFPLAIPTGMTVAALVTGNAVVLKPAEQSMVMGALLFEVLDEAGLPPGVLNYLPGIGEEVGPVLVSDPRVDLIAFTGSRPVGLEIHRKAAETPKGQDHVKRVIAEMGGKNAIIIDDDADLDEAVVGVLHSAFGYSGQKCSACSRVIVLDGVYAAFLDRLVEAARALSIGPAEDPDTVVGPVIDAEARERISKYREIARQEGRVVLDINVGELAAKGHFVGPLIVADVRPEARVAQEEIFGPVLAVLKARDLADALAIANGTEYALTGGLYSRSPGHIATVRRDFRVGNLYINRPVTGALVYRQPFGGFKLSGIGTKAGGTDYLREFLLTRVVTENTLRRGFAPEADLQAVASHV